MAKYIDQRNILLSVADGFGASVISPGHVHHNAMKLLRLGEFESKSLSRVTVLSEVFSKAGFKTKVFADIELLIWEKFIL